MVLVAWEMVSSGFRVSGLRSGCRKAPGLKACVGPQACKFLVSGFRV